MSGVTAAVARTCVEHSNKVDAVSRRTAKSYEGCRLLANIRKGAVFANDIGISEMTGRRERSIKREVRSVLIPDMRYSLHVDPS